MLQSYPNAFPQEALMMLWDKTKGRDVSNPDLIHAAWNVVGYALSQTIGGGQLVAGDAESFEKMTDEEVLAATLRLNGVQVDGLNVASFTIVPWILVAKIAIKLIVNLLA